MRELPILFSTPMVQAILNGTKQQTRRVIKPQPLFVADPNVPFKTADADPKGIIKCPYGQPGDRLYAKEAIKRIDWADGIPGIAYVADDEPVWDMTRPCQWVWKNKSLPSMYMPKNIARIWLEVTDVRVERLQDITEEDVRAEGIERGTTYYYGEPHKIKGSPKCYNTAKEAFAGLWNSLAKPDYTWNDNPYVWVIEFKKVE